jgi:hypothetical protein
MAVLADTHPTLLDLAKRTDPDGSISDIVEILKQTNEVLEDMVWLEGNLVTGNRTTIRTGIPQPTWRKMYGGVQPSKSKTVQVTDNTGMLEAYGEVDKALADLNGNTAAFRLSEDIPHIEGMSEEIAQTLFYGNEGTEPEAFTGLSARYNDSTAPNGRNIIKAGGVGTDNASIWLAVWGPQSGYGIVPKGSKAGLQQQDLGEVTIENIDGAGGRMQAYRSHYRQDAGLTVRDWRYFVRICNIDRSLLTSDVSTGANLPDLMFQAMERVPNLSSGRAVWYMDRGLTTKLRQQSAAAVKQSTLSVDMVGGIMRTSFGGIPLRRVDTLSPDEALVV